MAKAILTDDAQAALKMLTEFMDFSGLTREDITTLLDAEQMIDVVNREEPDYEMSVADIVTYWTELSEQTSQEIAANNAKRWLIDLATTKGN